MYFKWDESYSVGIETFDSQHKILFGIINRLHEGLEMREHWPVLAEALGDMVTYTKLHFKSEEEEMKNHGYPGFELHKLEHDAFADMINTFSKQFENGEEAMKVEVLGAMVKWLRKHVNGTDKQYGPFLADKGVR